MARRVNWNWLPVVLMAILVVGIMYGIVSLRTTITKAALSGAVVCRAIVMDADGTLVCIPKE